MNRKILGTILCVIVGLTAVVTAEAKEMYQWTDENGVVHYSDKKPAGLEVETSQVPNQPASSGEGPYDSAPGTQTAAQERREELAQSRAQARESQAHMEAQCKAWRAEVAQLEPNRRVFFTNEDGEQERMDDQVRVDRVAELKDLIERDC